MALDLGSIIEAHADPSPELRCNFAQRPEYPTRCLSCKCFEKSEVNVKFWVNVEVRVVVSPRTGEDKSVENEPVEDEDKPTKDTVDPTEDDALLDGNRTEKELRSVIELLLAGGSTPDPIETRLSVYVVTDTE